MRAKAVIRGVRRISGPGEAPASGWMRGYVDRTQEPKTRLRGLGDLVAKLANPIALVLNLDKSKCGCAKRQEALNRLVPFA